MELSREVGYEDQLIQVNAEHRRAFIIRRGQPLSWVELGDAGNIDDAIDAWRDAAHIQTGAARLGTRLRKAILDPLLPRLEGAHRLYVAPVDALQLAVLDALPTEEGGLVGDTREVRVLPSLAALLRPRSSELSQPSLLILGGVDYEAEVGAEQSSAAGGVTALLRDRAGGTERDIGLRSGFAFLHGTLSAVESIGARFRQSFAGAPPPTVLTGRQASKAGLVQAAGGHRYLHLGTHGTFDRVSLPSHADDHPIDLLSGFGRYQSQLDYVRAFSPMSLSYLALAGANRTGTRVRAESTLSAEELACFDQSALVCLAGQPHAGRVARQRTGSDRRVGPARPRRDLPGWLAATLSKTGPRSRTNFRTRRWRRRLDW